MFILFLKMLLNHHFEERKRNSQYNQIVRLKKVYYAGLFLKLLEVISLEFHVKNREYLHISELVMFSSYLYQGEPRT